MHLTRLMAEAAGSGLRKLSLRKSASLDLDFAKLERLGPCNRIHNYFGAIGGGPNKAFDLHCPLTVSNRRISITLTGIVREPMINGIEIVSVQNPAEQQHNHTSAILMKNLKYGKQNLLASIP